MAIQVKQKLKLGDFEIEPEKRRLTRVGGETVPLANKPFQVLLYLIENRERLVTRNELLERFWDGHDVYEEALSKCVGTIRKALSDQLDNPRFIETRWAEGYRYIGPLETETTQPAMPIQETEPQASTKPLAELNASHAAPLSIESEKQISNNAVVSPDQTKLSRRKAIIVLVCVVLMASVLFFFWKYRTQSVKGSSQPIRSVAVLPLKNLTGDSGQDYFADGITESLLTKLSKIESLKVIPLRSVFTLKNKEVDPKVVGQQLDVEAILEGSVRRSAESVQVDVRLVSTKDNSIIWFGDYRQFMRDIFALQDEIARNIVSGLRVKLSGPNEARLAQRYTNNVEAYDLYTQGRYFWNKRTVENLNKSIEFYEQAISKDPNYALAYTGLADCYQLLAEYEATTPKEAFTKARTAAVKALQIDDELAEAHTSLAYTLAFYDWDWTNAEREFKRALELNPNYPTAHQWYAELLIALARFDEARMEYERAIQLDPTSLIILTDLASYFYMKRDFDQSIAQSKKVIEMEPNFAYAYVILMASYGQKGMKREMAEAYIKSVELFGETREAEELRKVLAQNGTRAMWLKRLEQVDAPERRESFSAQWRALIYTWLDDKDKALDWLEKSFERRDRWIILIKYFPEYDSLRSDPRFQNLMRRIWP